MKACYTIIMGCMMCVAIGCSSSNEPGSTAGQWQEDFDLSNRTLVSSGRNRYFILEPGFQLVLEGGDEKLAITVLDETEVVDGVTTRIVEEREWNDGKLVEVSRNYFAMCEKSGDIFYFGEAVDDYQDGQLSGHGGAWRAGEKDARAGLIMPGTATAGQKYYQEMAPGVAMDRAEVIRVSETFKTPAGIFEQCLKTREGTALNPLEKEYKYYAPGIGLIQDGDMLLVKQGFVGQ